MKIIKIINHAWGIRFCCRFKSPLSGWNTHCLGCVVHGGLSWCLIDNIWLLVVISARALQWVWFGVLWPLHHCGDVADILGKCHGMKHFRVIVHDFPNYSQELLGNKKHWKPKTEMDLGFGMCNVLEHSLIYVFPTCMLAKNSVGLHDSLCQNYVSLHLWAKEEGI